MLACKQWRDDPTPPLVLRGLLSQESVRRTFSFVAVMDELAGKLAAHTRLSALGYILFCAWMFKGGGWEVLCALR